MSLPPQILRLFVPRPPLRYLPPLDRDPAERTLPKIDGVAQYLHVFQDGHDADYQGTPAHSVLKQQRLEKKKREAEENRVRQKNEYDPKKPVDGKTKDPFKTLFICRLNPVTNEDTLRRVFEQFGEVVHVQIVRNIFTSHSRRYAFVEMEDERQAKVAVREASGIKVDGCRLVVDVERARTVDSWLPRRLGGGLGGSKELQKKSGESAPAAYGNDRSRGPPPPPRRDHHRGGLPPPGEYPRRGPPPPSRDYRGDRGGYLPPPRHDDHRPPSSRGGSEYGGGSGRGGDRRDDYRDRDRGEPQKRSRSPPPRDPRPRSRSPKRRAYHDHDREPDHYRR